MCLLVFLFMRKEIFQVAIGAAGALVLAFPVFAHESSDVAQARVSTSTSRQEIRDTLEREREEIKENIQERREEIRMTIQEKRMEVQNMIRARKGEIKEKREEVRQRLDERRKEIIAKYFERMVHRLGAAIERQERFIERIESRIQKFKERGANGVEAERLIAEAKVKVQDAKDALVAAEAAFEDLKNSEDPKTFFEEVRELIHGVTQAVKDAHTAIVKAITVLKGASTAVTPSVPSPMGESAE